MAVVFCDAFDSYGATADMLAYKWGGVSGGTPVSWNSTAGVLGGGAAVFANSGSGTQNYLFTPDVTARIPYPAQSAAAFWFKTSATGKPTSTMQILGVYNSSVSGVSGIVGIATNGGLAMAGNSFSNTYFTGGNNVCDGNWHWIELVFSHNVNANIQIYVDTYTQGVYNGSNNSIAGGPGKFLFMQPSNAVAWNYTIDDFAWVSTATGNPVPTSFPLNQNTFNTLRPASDSAVQFTPNAGGSNYTQVREVAPDLDTTYVRMRHRASRISTPSARSVSRRQPFRPSSLMGYGRIPALARLPVR